MAITKVRGSRVRRSAPNPRRG